MKVSIYDLNTTCGTRYGLKNATTGDVIRSHAANWKTERGAADYATKRGWEVVECAQASTYPYTCYYGHDADSLDRWFTICAADVDDAAHQARARLWRLAVNDPEWREISATVAPDATDECAQAIAFGANGWTTEKVAS